jgi:hypothetical protein
MILGTAIRQTATRPRRRHACVTPALWHSPPRDEASCPPTSGNRASRIA